MIERSRKVIVARGPVINSGEGGGVKFYLYKKVEVDKVVVMLKGGGGGGGAKCFEVVLMWDTSFSHAEEGAHNVYTPLKGGGAEMFYFKGGGGKGRTSFSPAIFPFCSHPSQ